MLIRGPMQAGLDRQVDCTDALRPAFQQYLRNNKRHFIDVARIMAALTPPRGRGGLGIR